MGLAFQTSTSERSRLVIAIGLIAVLGLAAVSCYSPPPREKQCKDYVTLEAVYSTSDRVVSGEIIAENQHVIEPDNAQPFTLIYRTYKITASSKGTAEKSDEIHVAFSDFTELFLSGGEDDPISFSLGERHILFLKGRARSTEYPDQYGGTLWMPNGEPAVAVSDDSGELHFAVTPRYAKAVGGYGAPFVATLSDLQAEQP